MATLALAMEAAAKAVEAPQVPAAPAKSAEAAGDASRDVKEEVRKAIAILEKKFINPNSIYESYWDHWTQVKLNLDEPTNKRLNSWSVKFYMYDSDHGKKKGFKVIWNLAPTDAFRDDDGDVAVTMLPPAGSPSLQRVWPNGNDVRCHPKVNNKKNLGTAPGGKDPFKTQWCLDGFAWAPELEDKQDVQKTDDPTAEPKPKSAMGLRDVHWTAYMKAVSRWNLWLIAYIIDSPPDPVTKTGIPSEVARMAREKHPDGEMISVKDAEGNVMQAVATPTQTRKNRIKFYFDYKHFKLIRNRTVDEADKGTAANPFDEKQAPVGKVEIPNTESMFCSGPVYFNMAKAKKPQKKKSTPEVWRHPYHKEAFEQGFKYNNIPIKSIKANPKPGGRPIEVNVPFDDAMEGVNNNTVGIMRVKLSGYLDSKNEGVLVAAHGWHAEPVSFLLWQWESAKKRPSFFNQDTYTSHLSVEATAQLNSAADANEQENKEALERIRAKKVAAVAEAAAAAVALAKKAPAPAVSKAAAVAAPPQPAQEVDELEELKEQEAQIKALQARKAALLAAKAATASKTAAAAAANKPAAAAATEIEPKKSKRVDDSWTELEQAESRKRAKPSEATPADLSDDLTALG